MYNNKMAIARKRIRAYDAHHKRSIFLVEKKLGATDISLLRRMLLIAWIERESNEITPKKAQLIGYNILSMILHIRKWHVLSAM